MAESEPATPEDLTRLGYRIRDAKVELSAALEAWPEKVEGSGKLEEALGMLEDAEDEVVVEAARLTTEAEQASQVPDEKAPDPGS